MKGEMKGREKNNAMCLKKEERRNSRKTNLPGKKGDNGCGKSNTT
jgi:hypothetical protein